MGVPAEVRAVKRPVNTVVEDSGRDTPLRYAVRARAFSKYVPGGNPQPHNGKVVGHIINLQYVPIVPKMETEPDILSYGAVTLVKHVLEDIYQDLLKVFPVGIVFAVMALAILKVSKPKISAKRMSSYYKRTFVSKYFPGVSLSKNSISRLYKDVGSDGNKRKQFFELRIPRIEEDHHLVIDSTLKENNSYVNDLSKYSYKSRVKCEKDISIIFAYDVELKEPICSKVNPGNINDASALESFIDDNKINVGTIVVDKGFLVSKVRKIKEKYPNIGIVIPIRNNDKRIEKYNLLSFDNILYGIEDNVIYKKTKVSDNCYLYSYRDEEIAKTQSESYIKKYKKNKTFDKEKFEKKSKFFGVVVFETDKDQDALHVYNTYRNRWLIETSFKMYKSGAGLENTGVHGDFSVIGEEFVNFIATTATCRIVRIAEENGLFDDQTYSEMMEDLCEAWRKVNAPEPPSSADKEWVHTTKDALKTLEAFGLSTPAPASAPEPKRPEGRPKEESEAEPEPKRPEGRPKEESEAEPEPKRPVGRPKEESEAEPEPKRPVGRPRKEPEGEPKPKRPVGRPRKEPEGEPKPKRPVGRPRKEPEGEPKPKRPVGRPRKEPEGEPKPKRPVGRPRKEPEGEPKPKRPVGRPRKEPEGEPKPKRPVGRPRKEPEGEPKPKRPVGRPRKEPEGEPKPKRPVGRPRKEPEGEPKPKRPVGRPRKEPEGEPKPKRPVGRPRKEPEGEPKPKRPVGRPRKEPEGEPEPKRPVGRPRKEPEGELKPKRPVDGPKKEPTDAKP